MEKSRWWHIAVCVTAAPLAILLLVSDYYPFQLWGGLGSVALFIGGWFAVGQFAYRSPRAAAGFAVIVVVVGGLGSAFISTFAFIQVIAYPLVWTLAKNLRAAIGWNIALCASIAAGLLVGGGTSAPELISTGAIQGASLAFSLAFGLWISSISNRSEERQRILDDLRATQNELAAVNRDVGVTSERERLAREIHDTVAQDLTGLVMLAERARSESDPTARDAQLSLLAESARAALAEARSLIASSAPLAFTTGGIADALERLGTRFARETGMTVTVDAASVSDLERDTEVVLLRCAQEGLANVRKHAGAGAARITLDTEGDEVRLSVTDDGVGFDPATDDTGFGLPGLRDRLALVGGRLEVESARGAGSTITASLPLSVRA